MSMNLTLRATVECTLHLSGGDKKSTTSSFFPTLHTPTPISLHVMDVPDNEHRALRYITWARETSAGGEEFECIDIYHPDFNWDIYEENDEDERLPTKISNPTEDHIKSLQEWLAEHEGWKICWELC